MLMHLSISLLQEIIDLVNSNQIIVLSGETGCGKTTQVSINLLGINEWLDKIVIYQYFCRLNVGVNGSMKFAVYLRIKLFMLQFLYKEELGRL